jgi:hypothetical protein
MEERRMKVIFLDFDGVLNSAASFHMEYRIRKFNPNDDSLPPVMETLCRVCTSNFQYILDTVPDAKIVISSTWRELFSIDWLKDKLASYGIDSSRVIDKTPSISSAYYRGTEIKKWMEMHMGEEVTHFVIIDDNHIGGPYGDKEIVSTSWDVGLTIIGALKAIEILGGNSSGDDLPL